jgi:MATE family multidrug resistance protein
MVVPTWAAWHYHWGLYWAWTFVSAYVIALGFAFMLRFRAGKWKSMRVIERAPAVCNEDRETRIEDGEFNVEPIAAD